MNILYIGKNFTDDPSGRYYTDGDGSGEEFREEVLKPLLNELSNLTINIDDNVEGYGSSFLVEAFGGLIKHGYITKEKLLQKLKIEYTDEEFEMYYEKIYEYIDEAEYNTQPYTSRREDAISKKIYKQTINKDFVNKMIDSSKE